MGVNPKKQQGRSAQSPAKYKGNRTDSATPNTGPPMAWQEWQHGTQHVSAPLLHAAWKGKRMCSLAFHFGDCYDNCFVLIFSRGSLRIYLEDGNQVNWKHNTSNMVGHHVVWTTYFAIVYGFFTHGPSTGCSRAPNTHGYKFCKGILTC